MSTEPARFDANTATRAVRRGLWSVAAFLGAIGLAAVAIARTDLGALHTEDLLSRARPMWLLAATAIMSLAFVFMSLRWRALLPRDQRPPVMGLTAIILAGLLLNYALPGPVGELGAAWFVSRKYGVGTARALASGVTARAIGLATAALLGTTFWFIAPLDLPEGTGQAIGMAVAAIGIGGVTLIGLTLRPDLWIRVADHVADRVNADAGVGKIVHKLRNGVVALASAAHQVLHGGRGPLLEAAGWSTLGHLTVTSGIAVAIAGLDASVDWLGLVFTYTTTTAGAVVLFAFPGSQLGWDALFATLLATAGGLPQADAVAVSMLVRVQQLFYMVVGGGVVLWLVRDLRRPPEPDT